MSNNNCYPYLNNVLYSINQGTPWLIKFYKTHSPEDRARAFIKGGFSDILFCNLEENKLLTHIDLKPFYNLAINARKLSGNEKECSEQITLLHVNDIIDLWLELHEKTLKLLLSELKDHFEVLRNLDGDELFKYCFELLPYGNNYNKLFIDHFIQEVVYKHIK